MTQDAADTPRLATPAYPRDGAGRPPHAGDFDAAAARAGTAARFADLVRETETGERRFPLPGAGETASRFAALRAVAEEDLCVARLVEGHTDALAVLAELEGPEADSGERWGVWAAEPPGEGLDATRDPAGGWTVTGLKQYASGAHSCTHALVTARTTEGRRLFAVPLAPDTYRPVEGTWQALGMAGSDTPDVRFEGAAAQPVGGVEAYVRRPGFAHGGIGVAACWLGGAHAVTAPLRRAVARRENPFADAHLGAADLALYAAGLALERAAEEIDADPADTREGAALRALRARALVADTCARVLDHVGRATGAGPLCHDARHARAVADLTVYVRQHHAEGDLAALGTLLSGREDA